MLCLADFCDDDGRSCVPAVSSIARLTGLSSREVQRCIAWLEEEGHINVERRPGKSSNYHVHPRQRVGAEPELAPARSPRRCAHKARQSRHSVGESYQDPTTIYPISSRPELSEEEVIDLYDKTGRSFLARKLRESLASRAPGGKHL
jgi:hypothetical protein